jgi:hypothetical protein
MVESMAIDYPVVVRAYYGRVKGFIATNHLDNNPILVQLRRYYPTVQDSFVPFCELQGREVRTPYPRQPQPRCWGLGLTATPPRSQAEATAAFLLKAHRRYDTWMDQLCAGAALPSFYADRCSCFTPEEAARAPSAAAATRLTELIYERPHLLHAGERPFTLSQQRASSAHEWFFWCPPPCASA